MAALWCSEKTSITQPRKQKSHNDTSGVNVCVHVCFRSLVRGPGVFGEVQVFWNITPAVFSEFETFSGTVTMRDRQSEATITLKVPKLKPPLHFATYTRAWMRIVIVSCFRPETMTSLRSAVSTCSH